MLKTVTNSINASQIQTPITLPGNITLSTGNLIIGTSGKGIDFSATSGTGTSELLSDYEEGTWTPGQGGGLVVLGTFSSAGTYTKIGNQVTVIGFVAGSTSVAVGVAGIFTNGLPFSVNTANGGGSAVGVVFTSNYDQVFGANPGGTSVYCVGNITAVSKINFTITYFA